MAHLSESASLRPVTQVLNLTLRGTYISFGTDGFECNVPTFYGSQVSFLNRIIICCLALVQENPLALALQKMERKKMETDGGNKAI